MPQVAIRVDGGARIGTGHVVRCLTVAGALRRRGASVVFVGHPLPTEIRERIEHAGFEHRPIPEGSCAPQATEAEWPLERQARDAERFLASANEAAEIVVVDHYGLAAPWEETVGRSAQRIIVIDDLANRDHMCDVLLDQNWSGPATHRRYEGLVPDTCQFLLGPRYALLQDRYATLRPTVVSRKRSPRQVLVSFGGTDPTGESLKVLTALSDPELRALQIDLVVSDTMPVIESVRREGRKNSNVRLHSPLPTLADLLSRADLSVGAGGATTWERICLQVPSLVTSVAPNQIPVTRALHDAGAIKWMGNAEDTTPDIYRDHLRAAVIDGIEPPPPLVDGWGSSRFALAILPTDRTEELVFRPASPRDAPTFVGADEGVAGPEPRYLRGPVVWIRQIDRFERELEADGRAVFVIDLDGVPIGGIRLHARDASAIASYWVDDAIRGTDLESQVARNLRDATLSADGTRLIPHGHHPTNDRGGLPLQLVPPLDLGNLGRRS